MHLALAALLAFALMLPRYGFLSLIYIMSSVLAGAVTALLLGRREFRVQAISAASIASELLYLLILLLAEKPQLYY
jgi:hypothetical protein